MGFLLAMALLVLSSAPSMAQNALDALTNNAQKESFVQIRVLPERGNIQAGEEIWVAIEQSIAPHWHTYWTNPGDSGSETRIEWDLPEGFEISEIHWPTPYKIPYPPLLNYGYEDNVVLLQKLTAPDILPKGSLSLNASIDVLVCKVECIPEFTETTLILNDATATQEDNAAYIDAARTKLPIKTDWLVSYGENKGGFTLDFSGAEGLSLDGADKDSIEFFPIDWGVVENTATPEASFETGTLVLKQTRGERPLDALDSIRGILAYETPDGLRQAGEFTAVKTNEAPVVAATDVQDSSLEQVKKTGFVKAALLAVLGGLVLNLMPCVFPVLSIKALSLVKIAEKHPEQARIHGVAYTAGVILSFLTIAGILIALQASGSAIGWGFQLQDPVVVTLLAYLLFIIGLNLSGVFEFGNGLTNIGSKMTGGHGYNSSFFTGILATLVATPCTAPFMGVAIGYALLQPPIVSLSVFAALGFGLALPYLLLSFLPQLQHLLPKPGAWMDTFKQLLAFPMYVSAVWLIWVMMQQAGPHGAFGALLGLVVIGFGIWLIVNKPARKGPRRFVNLLIVLSFLMALGFLPNDKGAQIYAEQQKNSVTPAKLDSTVYSEEALANALATEQPVFVEMTAAWCITCKVNHASSINVSSTKALFAQKNVEYIKGDWTNQDATITKYLSSFGRNGVPIYVYYGAPDEGGPRPEPTVLPQILTPNIVAKYVQ